MYLYVKTTDLVDEETFGIYSTNKAESVQDKVLFFFIYQALRGLIFFSRYQTGQKKQTIKSKLGGWVGGWNKESFTGICGFH